MGRSRWTPFPKTPDEGPKKSAASVPLLAPSSADAKKFGLENFGNTCYANSVLQALYFCTPFRDLLLQEQDLSSLSPTDATTQPVSAKQQQPPPKKRTESKHPESTPTQSSLHPIPPSPPTLFSALRSLYLNISTNPGEKGTVAPKAFIDKLKELNEAFRNTQHQDAHEFLNFLLNRIVEEIEEEKKQSSQQSLSTDNANVNAEDLASSVATIGSKIPTTSVSSTSGRHPSHATLVHKLFEGVLTSETRCLTCETVSSRDESFLDLSIDIEQNSSLTACLRQFSASEMLCQKNKFFCDSCCDLQEAEKRMKIKKSPNVLALHLKRFKYQEDVGKYIKLTYRVAFPFELRLFNTVDELEEPDRLYDLFAIVVHIGSGPNTGHYISIIKTSGSNWLVFDDDNVYPLVEKDIPKYFGDSNSGSAYVLYYQADNIDLVNLGLRAAETPARTTAANLPTWSLDPMQGSPGHTSSPTLPPGLTPTDNVNGADPRKSLVEKSPKISSGVPSWLAGDKKNVESPLPLVPPLPVTNQHPPSPSLPTIPQVHEPEKSKEKGDKKEDKKEDKKKWRGLRMSLRMTEKQVRMDSAITDIPPSPRLQRNLSEHGSILSHENGLRPDARAMSTSPLYAFNKPNHLDDTHSAGSASSSPSSSSVLANVQGSTSSSAGPSHPSTSPSTVSSAYHHDASPPPVPTRKYSLANLTSGGERVHGSFERKKSVDLKAMMVGTSSVPMPEFAPSPVANSHETTSPSWPAPSTLDNIHSRTLPPLPGTPRQKSHRTPINNAAVFAEPEHFNDPAEDRDTFVPPQISNRGHLHPLRSATLPPESLGASAGYNISSDSGNAVPSLPTPATPGKHAKRKMSLTGWVGRKDKEKDKEREKDKEKSKDRLWVR